jgi:hypothetical protein
MKKVFICSLICRNGIIGGTLHIDDSSITYKTNKLTVDKRYRNLVLPYNEICELTCKRIVFTIATLRMSNGEQYKFMLFNKKSFNKYYDDYKTNKQ